VQPNSIRNFTAAYIKLYNLQIPLFGKVVPIEPDPNVKRVRQTIGIVHSKFIVPLKYEFPQE
jgi:hypothetical protein